MNQQALQTLIPTSAIKVGNFQFAAGAGKYPKFCLTINVGPRWMMVKVDEVQAVHKPILCKRLPTFITLVSESQLTRRQVVISLYAKVPITFLQ